jgi:outer membrane immunogenic protein
MGSGNRRQWRAVCCAVGLFGFAGPTIGGELLSSNDTATQWGGFYVGGQLGGAWSETDWQYQNHNWFNTLGPTIVINTFDMDGSGLLGGGQAGFNYQSGAWLFGIEGSVAGADLSDSRPSPFFPTIDRYTSDITVLTTVTGRVGYARGRWLAYAKGGYAGADLELTLFDRIERVRASSDVWADGWTVGAGGEYALSPSLSLAVEYNYADLDTGDWRLRCNCPGGVGGGTPVMAGDIALQSVTARLNYRFGK